MVLAAAALGGGGGRSVWMAAVLVLARPLRRGPACLRRPLRREAGGTTGGPWGRGVPGGREVAK